MATHNIFLKKIATKLGLGEEEKVINKAAEFERLLQARSLVGFRMTETSKVVICLDLAASVFGADMDNNDAIKYSGLKGLSYIRCKKLVEYLLNIKSEKLKIPYLCVILNCIDVQSLAERILKVYQRQAKTVIDLNLPQYVCMAVYQACRINKVKVSKTKLLEKSRLKRAEWAKLDADWTKLVDEKLAFLKKRGTPAKNTEKNEEDHIMVEDKPTEPYEVWKKRMLEGAYKELEQRRKEEEITALRRSRRHI